MSPADPAIALTRKAVHFIDSVLRLRPRVAAFDCDGTLWDGDSGEQFLYWELERGLVPEHAAVWIRQRYRDYQQGRVGEEAMCGEMVTIHEGLGTDELWTAGEEFFATRMAAAIFPEMRELTRRLREDGCQLWAVSSTNEWVVRAGARRFGVADDHVLAACVYSAPARAKTALAAGTGEKGVATGRLRMVPTDEDKAVVLRATLGAREQSASLVDAAFGNSMHDLAMLEVAAHPFAINANFDLQQTAQPRGWPIYFPMGTAAHNPAP